MTRAREIQAEPRPWSGLELVDLDLDEYASRYLAIDRGDEALLLMSAQGMMIRINTASVRRTGRATQGVKLIDVEPSDGVVAVAKLAEPENGEENGEESGPELVF